MSEEGKGKPSKSDINETAKEYQASKGDEPDSSKQFAAAGHQARQDAQKSGENLGDRDLSQKQDTPSKESRSENESSSTETSEPEADKK